MDNVTTIALDIAKSVFQLHGVDVVGEVVIRRKLTRGWRAGRGGGRWVSAVRPAERPGHVDRGAELARDGLVARDRDGWRRVPVPSLAQGRERNADP